MNGYDQNGSANGNGSHGSASSGGAALQWKVGLLNSQGRYLTAETFGCKINASGTALRKKQMWTIEYHSTSSATGSDGADETSIYVRSHLGRYLAGDKRGNVTCSSEELGDAERFVVEYHKDGSGRWALRNRVTGYYFGGTEDRLQCYEKQPGATEWWTVNLAFHPLVNLRNINRQKYVCLHSASAPSGASNGTTSSSDAGSGPDQLRVSALIPWGVQSLVTLEFTADGRYAVRTCDDRYLHRDGRLVDQASADTSFAVELKAVGGIAVGLALRDRTGKYLAGVGRDAVVQARNSAAGKDELFAVEESHPQVYIVAHNGKMVSIKQGVDPTANQDGERTDRETFQLEFDKANEQWRIRTADNQYWSVEAASGIQAIGSSTNSKGLFGIEWLADGGVALKAGSNGRYLTARMNGSLYAVSDEVSDRERFTLTLVNRPKLVLRCDHGFVGIKAGSGPGASGTRYECNRASFDPIKLISAHELNASASNSAENGTSSNAPPTAAYYLMGHNDRYMMIDPDDGGLVAAADAVDPQPFLFQLVGRSRLAIRAPNGNYLTGQQNGLITSKSSDIEQATWWEY